MNVPSVFSIQRAIWARPVGVKRNWTARGSASASARTTTSPTDRMVDTMTAIRAAVLIPRTV
jgi:hypothetical protein